MPSMLLSNSMKRALIEMQGTPVPAAQRCAGGGVQRPAEERLNGGIYDRLEKIFFGIFCIGTINKQVLPIGSDNKVH